jgi:hypothetical protein
VQTEEEEEEKEEEEEEEEETEEAMVRDTEFIVYYLCLLVLLGKVD